MKKRSQTVARSMTDSIGRMEKKNLLDICVANPENLNKYLTKYFVIYSSKQSSSFHFSVP